MQALDIHKPVDGAFLTAASPGVVALFQVGDFLIFVDGRLISD